MCTFLCQQVISSTNSHEIHEDSQGGIKVCLNENGCYEKSHFVLKSFQLYSLWVKRVEKQIFERLLSDYGGKQAEILSGVIFYGSS